MTNLYSRIRSRREELGMTQEELASKLNYKSRSTIAKIEAGENDIPQSKIEAFAKALATTPAYLMGWEPESFERDTLAELQRVEALLEKATEHKDIEELTLAVDILRESYEDIKLAKNNCDKIQTIAAHHDDYNWTEDELAEIEEFKKFVLAKRKNKNE